MTSKGLTFALRRRSTNYLLRRSSLFSPGIQRSTPQLHWVKPLSPGSLLRSFSSNPALKRSKVENDPLVEASSATDAEQRAARIREELNQKTGRGWTDPWDPEEMMLSKMEFDDLPEWSPDLVSRVSQNRVQIYPDKIPTLQALAKLALPPPPPPHPGVEGQTKAYALYRKRTQYKYIFQQVKALAEPKIASIQKLNDWQEKQDKVDELFEHIEFSLKESELVLGKHPSFGSWVERALEEYLRSVQKPASDANNQDTHADIVPIFMDCFGPEDAADKVVPSILRPLDKTGRGENTGKMVEEWELAAHKTSKRIMLRQCTLQIAEALLENKVARIIVNGRQGVGKTAAVAAIVASARTSGYIVLYLPDGDQMHQNGFYIEPNQKKKGIFDLPVLSQKACENFLKTHEKDLQTFQLPKEVLLEHFTDEQLQRAFRDAKSETMSMVELLKLGAERTSYASLCYSAAVDFLMNHQDEKPFLIAMDEFNCFYKTGQYFHIEYDAEVKKFIPNDQISLFKPVLDALALSVTDSEDREPAKLMKRGAVLVATTESHAVPRSVTDALIADANRQIAAVGDKETSAAPMVVCHVPRLSALEVEHMLANYEATGVGKLRLDRGKTVMNEQEVAYLRMVSGSVAQKLMDACMVD